MFGLEVAKSGYHTMLQEAVNTGETFDGISSSFGGKIGMEGLSILMAMLVSRDPKSDGSES